MLHRLLLGAIVGTGLQKPTVSACPSVGEQAWRWCRGQAVPQPCVSAHGGALGRRCLGGAPGKLMPAGALGTSLHLALHPRSVRPAVSRRESREAQDAASPPPVRARSGSGAASRTWAPGPLGVPRAPARLRLFSAQSQATPALVGFPRLPVSTRQPLRCQPVGGGVPPHSRCAPGSRRLWLGQQPRTKLRGPRGDTSPRDTAIQTRCASPGARSRTGAEPRTDCLRTVAPRDAPTTAAPPSACQLTPR